MEDGHRNLSFGYLVQGNKRNEWFDANESQRRALQDFEKNKLWSYQGQGSMRVGEEKIEGQRYTIYLNGGDIYIGQSTGKTRRKRRVIRIPRHRGAAKYNQAPTARNQRDDTNGRGA